jgi:hypothetical protein
MSKYKTKSKQSKNIFSLFAVACGLWLVSFVYIASLRTATRFSSDKQVDSKQQIGITSDVEPTDAKKENWKHDVAVRLKAVVQGQLSDGKKLSELGKTYSVLLEHYEADPVYVSKQIKIVSSLFSQCGQFDEAVKTLLSCLKLDSQLLQGGAEMRWADLNNLAVLEATAAERASSEAERKLHFERSEIFHAQAEKEFELLEADAQKRQSEIHSANDRTLSLLLSLDNKQ